MHAKSQEYEDEETKQLNEEKRLKERAYVAIHFCSVCIVYDTHGVPNAEYSQESTATRLKRDPRQDHSS